MNAPRKVYYVAQRGAKLRYGQKGGGLFSRLSGAQGRKATMEQQGGQAIILEADVEWRVLEDES